MRSKGFWIICALTLAIAGVASIAAAVNHPPDVVPANFVHPITDPNPFFPLVPGTTFFYEGKSDEVPTSNTTEVTCDTLVIPIRNDAGTVIGNVTATVVRDRAFDENGNVLEDTFDYYAQDKNGTVWYLGEDTTEFDPDTGDPISTEGTWREGVDDADAGFIMLASPHVGDRYFQEFAPGVAVDLAKVISLDESKTVTYGFFDNLLVTKETSQLDPGVAENKFYASGVGFIYGEIVKGGVEFTELVDKTFTACPTKSSGRH
jgi:hypothetical protein